MSEKACLPRFDGLTQHFLPREPFPGSIAPGSVDLTDHRQAFAMPAQIIENDIDGAIRARRACNMRCDANPRMRPQRMRGGKRLGVGHIENRATQLTARERREQILLVQVRAAPGLDQRRAAREFAE
jgi:hypothetical protein